MNGSLSWKMPALLVVFSGSLVFWNPLFAAGVVFLAAFLLWGLTKHLSPVIFWVFLLFIFYFFPYSTINPSVRAGGRYFTIFRKMGGFLSLWDVLLLLGVLVLFARKLSKGNLTLQGASFPEVIFLFLFGVWAFFWGWLHVSGNLLSYGPTELLRPVIVLQTLLYFFTVYLLTLNLLESRQNWETAVRWLKRLTCLLVIYGVARLIGILTGRIQTMWPFGLPVVLYDQMMFLYLPVFVWAGGQVLGESHWKGLSWLALLSVFFILISARRFNYFLLVAGILLSLVLAGFLTTHFVENLGKLSLKFTGLIAAGAFVLILFFPAGLKNVGTAFQSLNIYKSSDVSMTGSDIRRQEIKNLALNLDQRPYAFALGLGWGTKWKAITYQPIDSFSFTEKYLRKSLGWFPQFHIPYLGLIYRYGILGLLFFWGILGLLFYRIFAQIQKCRSQWQPLLLGMLVFLILLLPAFGDSANPTFMILSGFYLGLLEFRFSTREAAS